MVLNPSQLFGMHALSSNLMYKRLTHKRPNRALLHNQDLDAMNKTSLLMLIVGTILGVVIGYVVFAAKSAPEVTIEAEGFRNLTYSAADEKFDIEIVKRVDGKLDVNQKLRLPIDGFTTGISAMEQLLNDLVERGVLGPSSDASSNDSSSDDPPSDE